MQDKPHSMGNRDKWRISPSAALHGLCVRSGRLAAGLASVHQVHRVLAMTVELMSTQASRWRRSCSWAPCTTRS